MRITNLSLWIKSAFLALSSLRFKNLQNNIFPCKIIQLDFKPDIQKMGDLFQRLPPEILLNILKFVPSLPSLRNITLASNAAAEMFDGCGPEIVESVLQRLPEELQCFIRAVTLFLYDEQYEPKYFLKHAEFPSGDPPIWQHLPLPRDLPSSHLKTILNFSCHLQQLVALFLEHMTEKLNDLRPMHLKVAKANFTKKGIRRKYREGHLYTPQTMNQLSWVEEYRAIRAIWGLLLSHVALEAMERLALIDTAEAENVRKHGCSIVLGTSTKWHHTSNIDTIEKWLKENHFGLHPHATHRITISSHAGDARSRLEFPPTDEVSHAWHQDLEASR